ncbi:MAG: DUF3276 family protein [bacterium]
MEESTKKTRVQKRKFRKSGQEEVFSKVFRAGKRTYYFDVKTTRSNELFLTVTESKKKFNQSGRHYFEKHKIFLYKEDIKGFTQGLNSVLEFVKNSHSDLTNEDKINFNGHGHEKETVEALAEDYTNVEFEDLENYDE